MYTAQVVRQKTFEIYKHSSGSSVHLIKTYDHQERPCWFLLKANERSMVKLERTAYEDMIDLTQFGEIIGSGWGHDPDEEAFIFRI